MDVFLNSLTQNKSINFAIPEIKKKIKYCRNTMEKKQLQRKLNEVYKEQKNWYCNCAETNNTKLV